MSKFPKQGAGALLLLLLGLEHKLDGVGPVDNRPSPDKLHYFVQQKIKKKKL